MRSTWLTVRILLTLSVLGAPAGAGRAQSNPPSDPVARFATRMTIPSSRLGETRDLDVWVPRSYAEGTRRYPTLWVLDGEAYLLSAAGAVQSIANAERMPEMIVVAVSNRDRARDLTPRLVRTSAPPEGMPTWGGGSSFLAFLQYEAVPAVESAFRTVPFRTIVGHSLGGLFAMWSTIEAPGLFRASLMLDPALWWDNRAVPEAAIASMTAHPERIHRLVSIENPGQDGWRPDWSRLMDARAQGVRADLVNLEGESHGSMFHLGVYRGLLTLFADWVPEMRYDASRATEAALEEQYARLSRELGYQVPVPSAAREEVRRRAAGVVAERAPKVDPVAAGRLSGRWEGVLRTDPGEPIEIRFEFVAGADTMIVTPTARGLAVGGGDLRGAPSPVSIVGDTVRWEERRGAAMRYLHVGRLDAAGRLVGTVTPQGGPPLPAGFTAPKVTFEVNRVP